MARSSAQRSLFDDLQETAENGAELPREAVVTAPVEDPPLAATLEGKSVYVVDSHSLIYQVFHALPEMSSPRGEPVGAVFGFARDLVFLLEEKKPDYLFCAFDMPGKTFRHELFDQYKIHRPAMPAELVPQIASIRRLIDTLGIPALGVERYEADDVLATIARVTEELGGRCLLVTGDKDCRQLITDRAKLFNIRKNQIFDAESLREEWGISPAQVVDFQALVGDSTDNIPGVPLIGPKLARELLEKYQTLESVLDHAGEVSGAKRKQNLIDYREQAILSRELARLNARTPLRIDWDAGRTGRIDLGRALGLFREFGFRTLAEKVESLAGEQTETKPPLEPKYHLVDTPEALQAFLTELKRQKRISVDLETTSVSPRRAEIVGYAFSWNEKEGWYVAVRSPAGEASLDPQATLETLRPVLEDPAVEKIGQNLKYDMIVLRSAGLRLAGVAFDTMIASYLLDAGARNHSLDELARAYLGHTTVKITELIGSGKNQKRMDEVPTAQVAEYAGEDALVPMLLRPILAGELSEANLEALFHDLEVPLVDVLVEMEYNGIKVDVERLGELSRRFGQRMADLEREIHALAGREFNIGSPKQLQQILFHELHLPVVKKTKTGPSTDADVLEELAPVHPLPAKIVEYRQYAKLKNTYVDALPEMIHPRTGRVHASFNQVVTATGRLSCNDPNLQNIPVRTEQGREIRSAFVPGDAGWLLLAADYSQIELRVLAHFCGDQRLCEAFARDEDIHARVASQVYGVPLDEVTPPMRRQAKAVNFGVIYGQSAFGLARQLGIDKGEAAKFIDAYFGGYPGIEVFLEKVLAECRKNGYVSTILGRRRSIRGVRAEGGRQRNLAERTAINTVIQGSAADLIKEAMIAVYRRITRERFSARLLLQIHDELLFECPPGERNALAAMVMTEMSSVHRLNVPLKVDVKAGVNWADAEPWTGP
ncbi:MAG: DNA polymerase I [Rhodopirellula sp.]|nr:DNA polymerase I [Rhodopirellula sp.]